MYRPAENMIKKYRKELRMAANQHLISCLTASNR